MQRSNTDRASYARKFSGLGGVKVEPSPSERTNRPRQRKWLFREYDNKTNSVLQAPKNWIDQKGREVNDGFIHLGNEIGMFGEKLKHKVEQTVADWIYWFKEQAK